MTTLANRAFKIQRIRRALHADPVPAGLSEAFRAHVLTGQQVNYLNGLMPMDYMGFAEFELAAVPDALSLIQRDSAAYARFSMTVKDDASVVDLYGFARQPGVDLYTEIRELCVGSGDAPLLARSRMNEIFGVRVTSYRAERPRSYTVESPICAWLSIDQLWMVGTDVTQICRTAEFLGVPDHFARL